MPTADLRCGDCLQVLAELPDDSIDLTVTSPPYDNLRKYNGYTFDFEGIARQLYRVTKPGGVVVWVVADATVNGSETGTSFRQALYFRDVCGFRLHDTMIWNKGGFSAVGSLATRYANVHEFMFVLTKGPPRVFNPIRDRPNKTAGRTLSGTLRKADGTFKPVSNKGREIPAMGQRFNVWEMPPVKVRQAHPAPFPESLASDHVESWSNSGDLVLDPFMGSGTTGKVAIATGRDFIGIEISPEYLEMARARIAA